MLAARAALQREGVELSDLAVKVISRGLANPDPKMQLLALKWISDDRLARFRPLVGARLKDTSLTAAVYYAVLTTLARLESADANEVLLVKRLKEDIMNPSVPLQRKKLALEILPDRDKHLTVADLVPLMEKASPDYKTWLVHYLGTMRDVKREPLLHQFAFDAKEKPEVRAAALMHVQISAADAAALLAVVKDDKADPGLRKAAFQALQGAALSDEQRQILEEMDDFSFNALKARVLGKTFVPQTRPDSSNILVWKNYLEQVRATWT